MENLENKKLVLDVNENPTRIRDWFLFAMQHILAMLVACITVPIITKLPIGPTLVAAGIGTLIYIFTTERKSPVFLSSSFAYLSPMATALALGTENMLVPDQNLKAVMLGMIFVGIVYVVIALIIKKVGAGWLNKLLPPVVMGPVIMVIGLGLASSAVSNVMSGSVGASAGWVGTLISTLVALIACTVTAFAATSRKHKQLTLIPFVIGVVVAYVIAVILTVIGNAADVEVLKVIDFTPFKTNDWKSVSGWITTDFLFVDMWKQEAVFNWGTVGQVAILFIPVSLVTVCEHIGDHKNLGYIIGKDLLDKEKGGPGLTRTLIGDGVATAVSGMFCGAANTTYGENVAVVGVSRIASVGVIILASLMTIVFGMFRPFELALATIPSCITGGVSLILYGFIASSGVKMVISEKVDFNDTKNIIVASVILVSGIGGLSMAFGSGSYTITITSTALSMILGIILNAVLKSDKPVATPLEAEEANTEEEVK